MLPLLPLMSLPRILSPLFLRLAHRLHLAVPGLCVVGQEAMEVTVGRSPSTAPSSVNTRSGKGSEASEAPMPSWGCWRLRNAGSGVPEARGAYGNSLLLQSSIRDPPCIYIYTYILCNYVFSSFSVYLFTSLFNFCIIYIYTYIHTYTYTYTYIDVGIGVGIGRHWYWFGYWYWYCHWHWYWYWYSYGY